MTAKEKKEIEKIIRVLWVNIPAPELESRFGIGEDEMLTALGYLNR